MPDGLGRQARLHGESLVPRRRGYSGVKPPATRGYSEWVNLRPRSVTRGRSTPGNARHHRAHVIELVVVHGVTHPRVDPLRYAGTHAREHALRLIDTFHGNVEVGVRAAEEDGRSVQRATVLTRCAVGTDEATGQCGDPAVATRIARGELRCEACAL